MTNLQFALQFDLVASMMLLVSGTFFYRAWREYTHSDANKPSNPVVWSLMGLGFILVAIEICLVGNSIYVPQVQRPFRTTFVLLLGAGALFSLAIVKMLRTTPKSSSLSKNQRETVWCQHNRL